MSISLNEEVKTVTQKLYDRCNAINIRSVINVDKTYTETIQQHYERVTEIDGVVINKVPVYTKEYECSTLLGVKWTAPWGKEVTGMDVMWFIKYWNDHYEEGLAQIYPSTSATS